MNNMAKQKTNWRWVDWLYVFTIVSQLIYIGYYLE
ncbi:putative membrane protein [Latilactobacillus curvatus]|nr:putative membrane protein [Latilactobacillus curvatus]